MGNLLVYVTKTSRCGRVLASVSWLSPNRCVRFHMQCDWLLLETSILEQSSAGLKPPDTLLTATMSESVKDQPVCDLTIDCVNEALFVYMRLL